jgi:preprotein translocase subunit SecG
MYTFLTILILICSVFLVLIVLVQNSKGGGLASGFSSSNQVLGVRKTTDFLEKATWTAAGLVVFFCILITAFIDHDKQGNAPSEVLQNVSTPVNTQMPSGFGSTAQPEEPSTAEGLPEEGSE